jgi:S-adenosylmethionine synthetase
MARWIALDLLKIHEAKEVKVEIAYVIGGIDPITIVSIIDGVQQEETDYDCRPQAIIERFNLRRPIYLQTAQQGHFGFDYPWEAI